MSQHDFNIANAPGATVRADVNALAEALASLNSGTSAPSVTFAYMFWADTTNGLLKVRNPANSGWITLATISGSTITLDSGALALAVSGDWFGTKARFPNIDTSGIVEIGSTIDFHPDAAGTEDYRLRIARATGANGAATVTQTGSGGFNVVPGSGGFQINGVEFVGRIVGEFIPYGGSSLPSKCLYAYGQNVSRTTYAALFTAYGTTYGSGDGSTTFGLPDLRGRTLAGKDNMGGTSANRLTGLSGGLDGDVLGAAGGEETHRLTIAELASHSHAISSTHNSGQGTAITGNAQSPDIPQGTTSTGGDTPHNNVQPTFISNYLIYAGV